MKRFYTSLLLNALHKTLNLGSSPGRPRQQQHHTHFHITMKNDFHAFSFLQIYQAFLFCHRSKMTCFAVALTMRTPVERCSIISPNFQTAHMNLIPGWLTLILQARGLGLTEEQWNHWWLKQKQCMRMIVGKVCTAVFSTLWYGFALAHAHMISVERLALNRERYQDS